MTTRELTIPQLIDVKLAERRALVAEARRKLANVFITDRDIGDVRRSLELALCLGADIRRLHAELAAGEEEVVPVV